MRHNLPISERIEKHIVSKNGCWLTDLHDDGRGYPKIQINGKAKRLSRVMYELNFGEIPTRMFVCHKCDNPACINPDHLFLGTYQDNVTDRNSKSRQAKGSKCGTSKLNEEKVLEIKKLLAEKNLSQKEIGEKYGVAQITIFNIKIGKTWKHVTDQPTTNNITNVTNYNAPVTNNITNNYNCSECPRQLNLFDTEEFK